MIPVILSIEEWKRREFGPGDGSGYGKGWGDGFGVGEGDGFGAGDGGDDWGGNGAGKVITKCKPNYL